MATRPQRSNANRHPAAPLLEGKRTRRSTAEVAREKEEFEAKRRALLQKNEENIRKLQKLERDLEAREKENATQAARPPPEQPVTEKQPSAPRAVPRPRPASKANSRAATDEDTVNATPTGQRVQPGRIKRLRREDLEAYRERGSESLVPEDATSENIDVNGDQESAVGIEAIQAQATSGRPKKRKSEAGGEDEPTKKGKPSLQSGPTAAATSKFSTPLKLTAPRSSATPFSASVPTPPTSTPSQAKPQGIYVNDSAAGFELGDVEDTMTKDNGLAIEGMTTTRIKNVCELEVMDPAASAALVASGLHVDAPVPTSLVTASAPKGGWTMTHVKPLLGSFYGNFTHIFVPKLINFIGNSASGPWKLTGVNLIGAMQDLAVESFPDGLVITVAPRQPFYEVAKQKLSEYRNGVGNEAVEVVSRYMMSRRFSSTESRAEYAVWASSEENGVPFRYERITQGDDGQLKKHGLYQGTLIAETFAYHLSRVGKSGDQIRDYPCNALALTMVAVERALKMWRTGSFVTAPPRSEEAKFSDRMWGGSAQQYLEGITNLSDDKWEKILAKADKALHGYNIDSEDELGDEQDWEDIPLTGRAGIEDYDDDNDGTEMDGVEVTNAAGA